MFLCIDLQKLPSEKTAKACLFEELNLGYSLLGVKSIIKISNCQLGIVGYMDQDVDMTEIDIFNECREFYDKKICHVFIIEQENDNEQKFVTYFYNEDDFSKKSAEFHLVLKLRREDFLRVHQNIHIAWDNFQIGLKIMDIPPNKKYNNFIYKNDEKFVNKFETFAGVTFKYIKELNSFIERTE